MYAMRRNETLENKKHEKSVCMWSFSDPHFPAFG